MSVTDWFPTLLKAANINYTKQFDGMDLWSQILGGNRVNIKRRIVHVLDNIFGYSSIRNGVWKYVNGSRLSRLNDEWLGEIGNETDAVTDYTGIVNNSTVGQVLNKYSTLTSAKLDEIRSTLKINCSKESMKECNPLEKPCLFNIDFDPCERTNLADDNPKLMTFFESLVAFEQMKAVPAARVPFPDPLANPALHNNTWTWWKEASL